MRSDTQPFPPAPIHATVCSGSPAAGVAFVAGGARGLGNTIAVSFARESARGVAIVDIQDREKFSMGRAAVETFGTKMGASLSHLLNLKL